MKSLKKFLSLFLTMCFFIVTAVPQEITAACVAENFQDIQTVQKEKNF